MKTRLALAAPFFVAAISALAIAPNLDWAVTKQPGANYCKIEHKKNSQPYFSWKVLQYYKTEQDAWQGLENFKRKGTCPRDRVEER